MAGKKHAGGERDDVGDDAGHDASNPRAPRADAQRNIDALLKAALSLFRTEGVDVPVRDIVEAAGVGIGTYYRHFPTRSDLIAAVSRGEIDACADAAPHLAAAHAPFEALALWMQRYAGFIATKRGFAKALHSGDPAFAPLPAHFDRRLRPALQSLLDTATLSGDIRSDVGANDLLHAVANLCMASRDDGHAQRMVALLVDGMRHLPSSEVKLP